LHRRADHLAAFEAALFNTKSAIQGQAAVAMRAEAEAEFLRSRDSDTTAAKHAAVAEIERLKQQLQDAQEERTQKAELEALARVIAKLPEKEVLQGKISTAKAALAGLDERLQEASSTLSRRRAQFAALLRCVRDLEEILDEETAAEAAEGGIATAGDLTQATEASSSAAPSASSSASSSAGQPDSSSGISTTAATNGSAAGTANDDDDDDDDDGDDDVEELEEGEA
jgi:predicted  nucleic acid-binding Zn-ribbon protein